jgi:hypothetical protein
MSGNAKHGGLCTNCANDPTCTFPRSVDLPVLQCEEFTVGELSAAVGSRPSAGREKVPDGRMGLCCNCDENDACTFPSARQGVVHCEEYR